MYISFFISCFISFLILKKHTSINFNLLYFIFSFLSVFIGYEYFQINFLDDSEVYFDSSKYLYLNYDFFEIYELEELPVKGFNELILSKHGSIIYFYFLIFSIFGLHKLSLVSFYIISKSFACVYLYNFSSRHIDNFTKYKFLYFCLFLYEPWTYYFNNFFFLKEGFIFLFSILILINFFKIFLKFKFKYFLIIFLSIYLLYTIRFYYLYIITLFFIFYLFFIKRKIFLKKKNIYRLFLFLIFLIISNFLFENFTYNYLYSFYLSVFSILNESNLNFLGPIRFILSPIFTNILISEFSLFRVILALIYNFISVLLIFSIIFYDYKNNFINFILIYFLSVSFAQILSPDEILTGGRHRSSVVWTLPIFIVYFFTKYKLKFR